MTGRTRPLDHHPDLGTLARAQLGAVRRSQLVALGVTRHHVRRQVDAQRWRTIGPHVVILHTGPLTRAQWRWTAVLHAGPHAALAGLTALELYGLRGWSRDQAHVLVPLGVSVPPLPGLTVHTTRRLVDEDLVRVGGLPTTTVARSAVDAARWDGSPRRAAAVVLAVVQQRLATPRELAACLVGFDRVRYGSAIAAAIDDAAGGADSLAEVDVARLVARAGLPRPRRQVVVDTPEGPRRVDLVVDLPDGGLLVLEVDGVHHADLGVRLADAVKDAAVVAAGHRVLRIPVQGVRTDRGAVLRQLTTIREMAVQRGAG
jgi:very-short-patch-repair endonuclease